MILYTVVLVYTESNDLVKQLALQLAARL